MTKPEGSPTDGDFLIKLNYLIYGRILFMVLMLTSTFALRLVESHSPMIRPLWVLSGLNLCMLLLSLGYMWWLPRARRHDLFAVVQIIIDTCVVTFIVYLTGNFASFFSFLYLVVIIYASMLLRRTASMIMAALCSLQHAAMVVLEYVGFLSPFVLEDTFSAANTDWPHVLYKTLVVTLAFFAVAFLSSLLSEQARRTSKELKAMEQQVKRVEKMATIGEMAAGLAHEIKNPLASLAGSIQILKQDLRYDPDNERLMEIVLREADRLSTLVNNFLMYARPPAGRVEAIELGSVLAETLELFEKDKAVVQRISLRKEILPDMWVQMDAMHLRQVLWNLLLNAAEAIEDRGHIDIKLFACKEGYAGLRIQDDGCGISREILTTIFSPFFTTKPSGTGLGLSIVHSILESYGSLLDVESSVSGGTVFTLKFKRTSPPPQTVPGAQGHPRLRQSSPVLSRMPQPI